MTTAELPTTIRVAASVSYDSAQPGLIVARAQLTNVGTDSVHLTAGGCPLDLYAYRPTQPLPVWRSDRTKRPCPSIRRAIQIAPGSQQVLTTSVHRRGVLGDSLANGVYSLTVRVRLLQPDPRLTLEYPAGQLTLTR